MIIDTMLQDLRTAVRSLRKASGLTAITVVVLALGIGANTAIFSVVDAVLLRPLPYPDADRIVELEELAPDGDADSPAPANYLDWKAETRSFSAMAAYEHNVFNVAGDGAPEQLGGAIVTPEFFRVFGVEPAIGRTFSPESDGPGVRTAVLSDGLWRRRFGGATSVVGRTVRLGGESFTVVGVMPPGFDFPERAEVWTAARYAVPESPLKPEEDLSAARGRHYFDVVARVAPGATVEEARGDARVVASRIAAAYPDDSPQLGARLVSLKETLVGDTRPTLLILLGAVGFVLLVACANVANLLVARATAREKEMATRAALGASRWRLGRQLLVESLVLSSLSGAAGVLVAAWTVRPLAALAPQSLLGGAEPALDWRVLAFAFAASTFTGLLFGILPAVRASRVDLNGVLKDAARGSSGGASVASARGALVVFEIAASLVLLVGAGLMLESLLRIASVDPGFDARDLLTARVWLAPAKYPDVERKAAFFRDALERIRSAPGVRSAAAISRLPLTPGSSGRSFEIEGRPTSDVTQSPDADYRAISSGYFATMRIPLLAGRDVDDRDAAGAPAVAVVNETFARRYFPDEDAVGKRIQIGGVDAWMEIVGVAGDIRHADLASTPRPEIDVPFAQDPWPFMTIAVRTDGPVAGVAGALEEAVRSIDPDQPLSSVATMEQLRAKSVAPRRFDASLLGFFAAVALALAAIGVYGVVSFTASRRTREIGIRMALGADRRSVFNLVVGQGLALAAAGVLVGIVGALALTRLLSGLLYGVSPTDPVVYLAVGALLGGAAVVASLVPARRATRVDPMIALRGE